MLAEVCPLPAITLVRITQLLDRVRPELFHLAAHVDGEGVCLSAGADLRVERPAAVGEAILAACTRPTLVVLNFCGSIALGDELVGPIPFVIAWPDRFDDEQARSFTATLYSSLRYSTIRSSHEEALRELTSPDLAEPQLLGANQRDTQLFRTSDHGL